MSYLGGSYNDYNNGDNYPRYDPVPPQIWPAQATSYAPGTPPYSGPPGPISLDPYHSGRPTPLTVPSHDPLIGPPSGYTSSVPPHGASTLGIVPLQLGHSFRRPKQFRRLFGRILLRWLVSAAFCGGIAALFIFYEGRGVLDSGQKHWFNAGYLGFSLMLGLNLVSSFKSMADVFRWKVLASVRYGGHTAHEVDLVMGLSSYQGAVMLIKHWKNKPRYLTLLILWILLGIGAQVGVALLGLTFNHENEGAQQTTPGKVDITDLSAFYSDKDPQVRGTIPIFYNQNYRSHLYGDVSNIVHSYGNPVTSQAELGIPPEELDVEIHPREGKESPEFRYYFKEYILPQRQLISKSNRYITTSATCSWSPIISGQTGNSETTVIDYNGDGSGANNRTQEWTYIYKAVGSVLYNNPSLNLNETESTMLRSGSGIIYNNTDCGRRCGWVNIYRHLTPDVIGDGTAIPATSDFYECKVEVSEVSNAVLPEHYMPDNMAIRIASSIGSSASYDTPTGHQSAIYNPAAKWYHFEKTGKDGVGIAEDHVARFAIGSIAMLDISNPSVHVEGLKPWRGVFLKVRWIFVWATFGLILGAQAIVGIVVIIKSNNVLCKDQSYLSSSRLLRSAMDRLGDQGTAASGDEIAKAFEGMRMRYGVRQSAAGTQVLEMLINEHPLPADSKMPPGLYE